MAEDRILIVHQRREVADRVAALLQRSSKGRVFEVSSSSSDVFRLLRLFGPHLLVLGMRFSRGPSGKEILGVVRTRPEWDAVALLVVTESLKAGGHYAATAHGADACLRLQTMTPASLRKNVRALLSQSRQQRRLERKAGKLRVNLELRRAWCGKRSLDLTPMQFEIVLRLVLRPMEVHSHEDLAGVGHALSPQEAAKLIRVQMCRIRKLLGKDRGLIETVRGVGYRLRLSRVELARLAKHAPP